MPKTILLADDSPTVRGFCRVVLRSLDLQIVEASEGAAALEAAHASPPSLVIADVNMPGMSGIELVRALRADPSPALRSVPVLLLTGEQDEALRAEGLAAGANELVQKPIKPPLLVETVRRYLELAQA